MIRCCRALPSALLLTSLAAFATSDVRGTNTVVHVSNDEDHPGSSLIDDPDPVPPLQLPLPSDGLVASGFGLRTLLATWIDGLGPQNREPGVESSSPPARSVHLGDLHGLGHVGGR